MTRSALGGRVHFISELVAPPDGQPGQDQGETLEAEAMEECCRLACS